MPAIVYREVEPSDMPALARIRAADWETEEYWRKRIAAYLGCELHPQHALHPRVLYVACECDAVVGFIAGHLTRRFACDGELEWIDVVPAHRRTGIASELFRLLVAWFVAQNAKRVCVDVNPTNVPAQKFYRRHGAVDLRPHWLVWPDIGAALRTP